jgi:predicted Zn-dependent protease
VAKAARRHGRSVRGAARSGLPRPGSGSPQTPSEYNPPVLDFEPSLASRWIEPFGNAGPADFFAERRQDFTFRLVNGEIRDLRLSEEGGMAARATEGDRTVLVASDRRDEAAARELFRDLARRLSRTHYPKAVASSVSPPSADPPPPDREFEKTQRRLESLFARVPSLARHTLTVHVAHDERLVAPAGRPTLSSTRRLLSIEGTLEIESRSAAERRDLAIHLPAAGEATFEEVRHLAREAAAPAERPIAPTSGETDVLFADGSAAYFFHEVLAHPLEADAISSILHPLAGARLAPREIEVVDDPLRLDLFGGYAHDDEGLPARSVRLLDAGEVGHLLRSRAEEKGLRLPGGHGRRAGVMTLPRPRSANVVISPGGASEDEMTRRLKDGLRVARITAGTIDPASGQFRLRFARARLVRRGRIVSEVTSGEIAGSVLESLGAIDPIVGARAVPCRSLGWCGREGHFLPVGGEAPMLIVRRLAVRPTETRSIR